MKASLYGSPAYLEKFGEPKEVKDLDHHRLITFARGNENPYSEVDWMLKIGREGRKKRKPFYTSNSTANILEAAEQGVGLITFYDLMERHRKSPLRPVLKDVEGPVFKDYIATPIEKNISTELKF